VAPLEFSGRVLCVERWAQAHRRAGASEDGEIVEQEFSTGGEPQPAWPASGSGADLTPRQWEVACLLAEGLSEAEVAARLYLSEHTVHEHIRHIYERLGCHRRGQLVAFVLRAGIHN